jgi:hypothetical protein
VLTVDGVPIAGSVVNALDGSAGAQWDIETVPLTLPAGVAATTVQLVSEPLPQIPDSLLWVVAALRVAVP